MQSSPPFPLVALCSFLLVVSCLSQQQQLGYPTANLSMVWRNSPTHGVDGSYLKRGLYVDGSIARVLLLRINPDRYGPSFGFGFFCFKTVTTSPMPPDSVDSPPCTDFILAVAFVSCSSGGHLTSTTFPQVIWSANLGRPIHDNATLRFSSDGDLVLRDADGVSLWSAGTAGRSVAGINMTSDGNLVIFNDDNNTAAVWQSFDNVTDVLVPGQWLKNGYRLTPNVSSATNWTKTRLYLAVTPNGFSTFVDTDPPQQYSSSNWVTLDQAGYIIYLNGSLSAFNKSGDEPVVLSILPYITSLQVVQYLRFETDGHLRLYHWVSSAGWEILDKLFLQTACDYPTVCGPYGICSSQQCSCPPSSYFSPVNEQKLSLGCVPVTPVSCQSVQYHKLLSLEGMNTFNRFDNGIKRISEDDCKQTCLKNCSCMVAVFNYGTNQSDGQCYLHSEVFSLQSHIAEVKHYNSSVHLRVHQDSASTLARNMRSKHSKVGIALGVVSAVVSLVVSVLIVLQNKDRRSIREGPLVHASGLIKRRVLWMKDRVSTCIKKSPSRESTAS